jgi:hypothetical protein
MYSSNINIIGGYENFSSLIFQLSEGDQIMGTTRTLASKNRFKFAVQSVFLNYTGKNHELLFQAGIQSNRLSSFEKNYILLLQFAANDELFFKLFTEVYVHAYHQGRSILTRDDVSAYLYHLKEERQELKEWSENTIDITGSKFLTLLKKVGIVEGSIKKKIKEINIAGDLLVFILYWIIFINKQRELLTSKLFPFLLQKREKLIFNLKQEAVKKYLHWNYNGQNLIIEHKITFESYLNELSN